MRMIGVHRLHYRGGGAESVHLDHLMVFREMGWDCAEFVMDHERNEPSEWQDYFPSGFDPAAGGLVHKIKQVGRFIHSSEAREKFTRLLDDFKPDIVHIHGLYHHLTPSILKPARERGIPMVFTLHDYALICPANNFYNEKIGICEGCRGGKQWRCATRSCKGGPFTTDAVYALDGFVRWHTGTVRDSVSAFVGPSHFIVEKFAEHGYPREKLFYVPNFFETTDDAPDDHAMIARLRALHGRYVLNFGRLTTEKGVQVLIDACARAKLPLVVAGDGPRRADLEARAAGCGVPVTFVGHQSGAALWSYVSGATAVCLPSIWYENAPKSLLEAQARGKVVIASDVGGMPEMVIDGETGFLVPPGNVGALARALERVFAMSETERADMGERGNLFARTHFTRQRYFDEMTRLYERLLAQAPSRASTPLGPVAKAI